MLKKYNPNLVKMTELMMDGAYHDGDTLGQSLKMTRSAVWKMIKKLEQYGVTIHSLKGRGYALPEPLQLLDQEKIKQALTDHPLQLVVFESLDSTNLYLKKLKHDQQIKIVLAEQQTQGKGRLSREWYSPFAQNIYLSCWYPFQKDISELSGLSLVISLAVVSAMRKMGVQGLYVKWPNDIFYQDRKVSGNLIEIQAETHGACYAIIGIGVNVNMLAKQDLPISQPYTSMREILGAYVDRNQFAACLINELMLFLKRFEQAGFTAFVEEWTALDCLMQQTVDVKNANQTLSGVVKGITQYGHLILQLADGAVRTLSSGDTSVRKK